MKSGSITPTKIFGWVLLVLGVTLIGWALLNSYNVFTGKVEAPQILKVEPKVESPSLKIEGLGDIDLQKQMEGLIQSQLKGILPADSIPKLLNLVISSILAGIFIVGGGQISTIGIRLIK